MGVNALTNPRHGVIEPRQQYGVIQFLDVEPVTTVDTLRLRAIFQPTTRLKSRWGQ